MGHIAQQGQIFHPHLRVGEGTRTEPQRMQSSYSGGGEESEVLRRGTAHTLG